MENGRPTHSFAHSLTFDSFMFLSYTQTTHSRRFLAQRATTRTMETTVAHLHCLDHGLVSGDPSHTPVGAACRGSGSGCGGVTGVCRVLDPEPDPRFVATTSNRPGFDDFVCRGVDLQHCVL